MTRQQVQQQEDAITELEARSSTRLYVCLAQGGSSDWPPVRRVRRSAAG
jgi:hypothetical protein